MRVSVVTTLPPRTCTQLSYFATAAKSARRHPAESRVGIITVTRNTQTTTLRALIGFTANTKKVSTAFVQTPSHTYSPSYGRILKMYLIGPRADTRGVHLLHQRVAPAIRNRLRSSHTWFNNGYTTTYAIYDTNYKCHQLFAIHVTKIVTVYISNCS